jgi:hypothetical protein
MTEQTYNVYFRDSNGALAKIIANNCTSHEEAIEAVEDSLPAHSYFHPILAVIK